jgi:transposase-like protein
MPRIGKMDLPRLMESFWTDDKCRAYLEDLRWPQGVRCPRCASDKIARVRSRRQYDCSSCRYRFSVTVGTIFHDSHLPLWKWFAAVALMVHAEKGISSSQLQRALGIADKTAWYLTHRIRAAMRDDSRLPLEGVVETDATSINTSGDAGPPIVDGIVAVRASERDGDLRTRGGRGRAATAAIVESLVRLAVSERAEPPDPGPHAHADTIENAWSVLKRSILASHHKLSTKHLPAYLDEFIFRFKGRKNPYLFRDTLLRLIGEEPLKYTELTQAEGPSPPHP